MTPNFRGKDWSESQSIVSDTLGHMLAQDEQKMRILEGIDNKQDTMLQTQAAMGRDLQQMERELLRLNELITGNGHPERGLIVRIDRLEQTGKSSATKSESGLTKRWAVFLAAISAVISAAISVALKFII